MKTPPLQAQANAANVANAAEQASVVDMAAWPLTALDKAFAQFLMDTETSDSPWHAALAALTSHQFGRGHACLDLELLADTGARYLGWEASVPLALPHGAPSVLLAMARSMPWIVGDASPLVLSGHRLYLRRNWQAEQDIHASIERRLQQDSPLPGNLATLLDKLFPATPAGTNPQQPDWQKVACALAVRNRFTLITGGPGTGKTTTVVKLLALLHTANEQRHPENQRPDSQRPRLRLALAAPTGKAAARLTESIAHAIHLLPADMRPALPDKAVTLHKLLHIRPQHLAEPTPAIAADVVIVDEASMIDLEMMARLLAAVPLRASLILLGDKDQLASVEAGAVMAQLCAGADIGRYATETVAWVQAVTGEDISAWQGGHPDGSSTGDTRVALAQQTVMLRVSRRFLDASGIGQWAKAVNGGDQAAVRSLWRAAPKTTTIPSTTAEVSATDAAVSRLDYRSPQSAEFAELCRAGWQQWLGLLSAQPGQPCSDAVAQQVLQAFANYQVLSAVRDGPYGVDALNRRIAQSLKFPLEGWYGGRPVMVTRNDYHLGLMNGDVGICLPHASGLRVAFADGQGGIRWVLPSRLDAIDTVFAMTVHKSQGSEFEHVCLVLPDQQVAVLTRELLYTGITRAKARLTLAVPLENVLFAAVQNRVLRSGGLAHEGANSGKIQSPPAPAGSVFEGNQTHG